MRVAPHVVAPGSECRTKTVISSGVPFADEDDGNR